MTPFGPQQHVQGAPPCCCTQNCRQGRDCPRRTPPPPWQADGLTLPHSSPTERLLMWGVVLLVSLLSWVALLGCAGYVWQRWWA